MINTNDDQEVAAGQEATLDNSNNAENGVDGTGLTETQGDSNGEGEAPRNQHNAFDIDGQANGGFPGMGMGMGGDFNQMQMMMAMQNGMGAGGFGNFPMMGKVSLVC